MGGILSIRGGNHGISATRFARLLAAGTALFATAATGLLVPQTRAESNVVQLAGQNGGSKRVKLGLNKSIVIDLPRDAYDILVANPDVADAVTRTARRIYLFGKQVGQTNIFVFGPNGEQIASLDLEIERDVTGLNHYLKKYIPGSEITVELINDNVVLTGTVQTPQDAAQAAKLAGLFVSGGEATTGQYATTASAPTDGGGVDINNPDSERRASKIVNMIKITGEDQVTLKVTVAEVNRSVMKQLGVNMIGSGSANGISYGGISENIAGFVGKAISNSGAAVTGQFGSGTLSAYLNAMELAGVMKTLAEPTLTAISGEKAVFKVGGEYNIISGQDVEVNDVTGKERPVITHEKIEYGIGLEFMPVVLSPGRISLKVRTSVSEPVLESSIAMSGGISGPSGNILSLRKRLADTTVELPSGGSMMIAGLIRDETRQAISGYPGLSKIPVLGALFRSRDFVRNETELVILITPYLVRPVARTQLARPDDNLAAASDAAGYILGRVNRVYGTTQAQLPPGRYHGAVGYIYK
ncbi:type II and III secretion system protein family protein [Phyllobacterium salinisoli]|uniref:Type II and III secretion system protein family protein n=1 Tax=Phyllobacterium salinisoli TaxID=1899321 RepID=A0A368K765_9HYPH|nr:type II and III secretion system protein family protein [Phyllobacterium salinisoli]RCS25228.1 type II and III secretion system protein family protein [Phyllobacterium salinisoli]